MSLHHYCMILPLLSFVLLVITNCTYSLIIHDPAIKHELLVHRSDPNYQPDHLSSLFIVLINHIESNRYYDDAERVLQALEYSTGPFTAKSMIMSVIEWENLMMDSNITISPGFKKLRCPLYRMHVRRQEVLTILVYDMLEDRYQCEIITAYPDEPVQFLHPVEYPLSFSPLIGLMLKPVTEQRYGMKITFKLPETVTRPVEIAWAHFRGNTQIYSIGEKEGEPLVIYPGESIIQYTHAGHLFVIREVVDRSIVDTRQCTHGSEEEGGQCGDNISSQEEPRILALYLIPAVVSIHSMDPPTSMDITININQSLNIEILSEVAQSQPYYVKPTSAVTDQQLQQKLHFESLLWTYWEFQRRCQIHLNSWFVPSLPLQNNQDHTSVVHGEHVDRDFGLSVETIYVKETTTQSLWKKIKLSSQLATQVKEDYYRKKQEKGGRSYGIESAISMVFNQHEVNTYYVPLESSLLRRMEQEVIHASTEWLEVPHHHWEVSSSYGVREYRRDAIIRWHVDPTESQPITAIIHIADSNDDNNSGNKPWAFQVPKVITGTEKDLQTDNLEDIFLEEGEMLLIQTAKLPHARIKPLEMDYYGNAFVHIAPTYWRSLRVVNVMY